MICVYSAELVTKTAVYYFGDDMKVYLWGGSSNGDFMDVPDHIREIEVRKPNQYIYPTLESVTQVVDEEQIFERYVKYTAAKIRGEDVIVFKHDKLPVRL